jgi:peptide deformylase
METQKLPSVLLWDRSMSGIVCPKVESFDAPLANLAKTMFDVMIAYNGIGLAAPQIDANIAVAVMCYEDWQRVMVNPEIIESSGESYMWEGCLSLPGASITGRVMNNRGQVKRAEKITVRYSDIKGAEFTETYTEFRAHIVQHEIDHLHGRFIFERMSSLERGVFMRKFYNFKRLRAKVEYGDRSTARA